MATLESLETAITFIAEDQMRRHGELKGEIAEFREEVRTSMIAMNGRGRDDHDKIITLEQKQENTVKRVDRLFGLETLITVVSSSIAAIIGTRQ